MKKTSKTKKPAAASAKKSKPVTRMAPAPAPIVRKTAPKVVTTVISARLDVGFGNHLYLRGEGPGLSWDKGIPMECVADDRWSLSFPETSRPIVFKFVLNDEAWSVGDDYTAAPGMNVVLTPLF